MRRGRVILALLLLLPIAGCTTMRESFVGGIVESTIDCGFDAVFGSSTDHVDDDEARMLERKGIEPGSERHRIMNSEEERFEEIHSSDGR